MTASRDLLVKCEEGYLLVPANRFRYSPVASQRIFFLWKLYLLWLLSIELYVYTQLGRAQLCTKDTLFMCVYIYINATVCDN